MKILQIINLGCPAGGAEKSVLLLRDELIKRGHEVKIISSDTMIGNGEFFSDYQFKSIPLDSIFKAFHHLFYFRSYVMVKKVIREFHPDVVHCHNVAAFSPSVFFAVGRIPTVMTVHGPEEFTLKLLPWFLPPTDYKHESFNLRDLNFIGFLHYFFHRFLQRPIYLLGARKVRFFISPSKYLAEAIQTDLPKEKIRQIYNGIILPVSKPIPDNTKILFVGRLEKVKGVEYLIKAFGEFSKTAPDSQLVIVGDGVSREDFVELAQKLGIANKVIFRGWIGAGEIAREYEDVSVLVVPSVWPENLATVCIEAFAVGRPVIGTRTGGFPEMIEDGKNGYLVPIEDEKAICDALRKIFGDKKNISEMGANAVQTSKRFDLAGFVDNIVSLYEEII
jgi:glycosyltransferase involved in cell wall biosynthesis